MTILSENLAAGGFIASEAEGSRSREKITVATGQNLKAGAVIARVLATDGAPAATNTGNGALTVGAAIGASTIPGIYRAVCVAAAANAGTFNLYAPDGTLIRQITVGGGATVSPHLTLTIADGSTDFAVGDSFEITVTEGSWKALAPAGTDGTQIAAGALFDACNATASAKSAVAIVREATFNDEELTWPTVTQAQKDAAVTQLNSRGVLLRNLQAVAGDE
jgi:hypothetical protein